MMSRWRSLDCRQHCERMFTVTHLSPRPKLCCALHDPTARACLQWSQAARLVRARRRFRGFQDPQEVGRIRTAVGVAEVLVVVVMVVVLSQSN